MPSRHGTFVWYELMTSDPTAAETFYGEVVGWSAQAAGITEMPYAVFSAGETPVAGVMQLPAEAEAAGARPGWIGYVAVDSVDESTARLKQAGGMVHREPADIPGVGRFAVVADPQGAVLALYRSVSEGGPETPGAKGHAGWRELLASDQEAVFPFYRDLFGWEKAEAMDMGPMGIYQLFSTGGETIGGMMTKPAMVPAPFWLFYFVVDEIEAAKSRVEAAGGQIVNGPVEVPGGTWIVQGLDPQGAMFALVGPRS